MTSVTNGIDHWVTNTVSEYKVVTSGTTRWSTGWYVVKSDVTLDLESVTCEGDVKLILCDGKKLTVDGGFDTAGIETDPNGSFTVYGQKGGTGALGVTANNQNSAGIGGGDSGEGSNITINGGVVTATGGSDAGAGIGGGFEGDGSNITINGGKVTATGCYVGAGIGGGDSGAGSNITINGGEVNATGGSGGAGIGGGDSGAGSDITINGGEVTATCGSSGAGIGGGYFGAGSDISINGGTVTATGSAYAPAIGSGRYGDAASGIFVADNVVIKADNSNPPTTVIKHASITTDIAGDLAGKRYATADYDYLTFTAEEANSSVTFKWLEADWVSNSTDGVTWNAYTAGTTIPLAKVGDKVMFKGVNVKTGYDVNKGNMCFSMTGKIAASGDVGTLTDGKGGTDVTLTENCYYQMFFKCASLTAAPQLPATNLAEACYYSMFNKCSSLTTAPVLPATTLATKCYCSMLQGCTSLTNAPALPAMALAEKCYTTMFNGCTSLMTAPELPATTLATKCYSSMFMECKALMAAPALSAMNLAPSCYRSMFCYCTSLTNMPALPAKTLAESCYQSMFYGCSSLIVNEAAPGKAWLIPAGTTTPTDWNTDMFGETGGTFTGNPEVGKTYYVGAKKEAVGDATLYRYEDKVGMSVKGELTKDIADTLKDKAITNLVVGTGVTKIGDSAFASWRTLRDVEIGADCVEVGALAFGKCHNVTNIACAATGTITIGNNAFVGCNSLEALSFGAMPDWGETPFLFYSGIYMKNGIPEVYAMPTVTITGYTQVLKGSNDLKTWENVDTTTPEGKAKYHFFKIALEAEY